VARDAQCYTNLFLVRPTIAYTAALVHSKIINNYLEMLCTYASKCKQGDRQSITFIFIFYIYRLWENPVRTTRPISARVTCYMSDLLRRILARASVIGHMHFGANEYAVSLDQ